MNQGGINKGHVCTEKRFDKDVNDLFLFCFTFGLFCLRNHLTIKSYRLDFSLNKQVGRLLIKSVDRTHIVVRRRASKCDRDQWRSRDRDRPVLSERWHGDHVAGDHVAGDSLRSLDMKHLARLRQHYGTS